MRYVLMITRDEPGGGKRLVTDGPFAETREQLGGYMIVDVKSRDEAIDIAGRIPLARTSSVERRPVREGERAQP